MRAALLTTVLWMCGVIALPSPAVQACMNEVYFTLGEMTRRVSGAERSLRYGKSKRAFKKAHSAMSTIAEGEIETDSGRVPKWIEKKAAHLATRAERVVAIAVVRLGGKVNMRRGVTLRKIAPADAKKNLVWARDKLVAQRKVKPDDPVLRARMAEALSAFPDSRAEARRMITTLVEADLVPDAETYRVLAHLEHLGGRVEARDVAVAKCKSLARRKKICSDFM